MSSDYNLRTTVSPIYTIMTILKYNFKKKDLHLPILCCRTSCGTSLSAEIYSTYDTDTTIFQKRACESRASSCHVMLRLHYSIFPVLSEYGLIWWTFFLADVNIFKHCNKNFITKVIEMFWVVLLKRDDLHIFFKYTLEGNRCEVSAIIKM